MARFGLSRDCKLTLINVESNSNDVGWWLYIYICIYVYIYIYILFFIVVILMVYTRPARSICLAVVSLCCAAEYTRVGTAEKVKPPKHVFASFQVLSNPPSPKLYTLKPKP